MNNLQELKLALPSLGEDLDKETPDETSMRSSEQIFASSSQSTMQQIITKYLPTRAEADELLQGYTQGDAFIQPFVSASTRHLLQSN